MKLLLMLLLISGIITYAGLWHTIFFSSTVATPFAILLTIRLLGEFKILDDKEFFKKILLY